MDKILEKIIETDRQAREKVNTERQRLAAINDEIAEAKADFDKSLQNDAEKAIEQTKKQMEQKLSSETERIDAYFTAACESLNKAYCDNRERWTQEIFEAVTKS